MVDSLFGDLDDFYEWKKEWIGMPEFFQDDEGASLSFEVSFMYKMVNGLPDTKFGAFQKIWVHFRNEVDMMDFANILGVKGLTSEHRDSHEFVLKHSTQYAFVITNTTADDNTHNIVLNWYEHTNIA